jgi:hypothetical protein
MAKSRKNRSSSFLKNITKTSTNAIPVVGKGLKNVGSLAKGVASKSVPVVQKGVSSVYGTLASGFDLGLKGVNSVAKGVTRGISKKKRSKGGRKSRKH